MGSIAGAPLASLLRALLVSRAVASAAAVAIVVALGFGLLVPVLPLYARSFGVPATQVGLVVSAFALWRLRCGRPGPELPVPGAVPRARRRRLRPVLHRLAQLPARRRAARDAGASDGGVPERLPAGQRPRAERRRPAGGPVGPARPVLRVCGLLHRGERGGAARLARRRADRRGRRRPPCRPDAKSPVAP